MKNKKGFTMIELIAVVVILGILSAISIAAYSKFVSKAKEQTEEQNKNLVVNAAKSYLESNTNIRPKEIGESVKIGLWELKNANYLKSLVYDKDGNSCMDKSYVYVHRNSYGEYTYESVLKCGNAPAETSSSVAQPVVKDFSFINSNNLQNAAFSMTLYGSENNTVEIEAYSYTITVIDGGDNNNTNTYSSKTISGAGNKKISVKNVKLSDYIDVTGLTKVKVNVVVKNVLGGVNNFTKELEYKDTTAPICGTITGQAANKNDWTNRSRTITVGCSDGTGSGCVRDKFSKTWPRENERSIERTDMEIVDNANIKNTCSVLVNVDTIAPRITITAKNKATGTTLFTKTTPENQGLTINATDYNNSTWLNATTAPQGIQYDIEVQDDMYLTEYKWEENNSNLPSGSANATVMNNNKTQRTTINTSHRKDASTKSYVLNSDGVRYAKITAKDKAGNETVIIINLNLDRVDPTCTPSITDLNGNAYTPGTWLKKGEGVHIYGTCSDTVSKCTGDLTPLTYNTDMEAEVGWGPNDKVYDHAGNSKSCERKYQVNIDTIPPEVSINVTPRNKTNSVLTKTATAGGTTSIAENEYSIRVTSNNWLNAASYPDGVAYNMTVTDNKFLYNELWQTNATNLGLGTSNSVIKTIPSSNNWTTTYEQPSTGHLTYQQVTRAFEGNGLRYGVFQVSDRAGNTTTVNMRANVDHTPPKITIHPYKIASLNGTNYTGTNGNAYYNPNNTSQTEVSSTNQPKITVSRYKDVEDNNNWMNLTYYPKGVAYKITMEDSIAQLDKYRWETGNYTPNQPDDTSLPSSGYNTVPSNTTSYGSSIRGFTLTGNGRRYARIIAYDKAGNSNIGHMYAKIDNKAPTCSYNEARCASGSAAGWTKNNRTVSLVCNDETPGSGCETSTYYQTFDNSARVDYFYPVRGDRTIYDNAQNERLCPTAVYTCIDKTKPYTPYVNSSGIVKKSGDGSITSYDCYTKRKERSTDEEYCDVYMKIKKGSSLKWIIYYSAYDEHSGISKFRVSFNCSNGGSPYVIHTSVDASTVGDLEIPSGYNNCNVVYTAEDYMGNVSDQLFIREHVTRY